jgi:serine/threonine-protein kinase
MAEELDEVILAYVEAVEAGQSPDRAAWLARHPHLADDLNAFFADQDRFATVVAPICVRTPPPSPGRASGAVVLDARPPLAAGCVIGGYELLDEIASGGMGVVYRARHQALGRVVALKMIRADGATAAEDVARFRLEAEAAALLDHPNIVPIYDVGEHEGQPYFTMKLIEGGSLAQSPPVATGELVRVLIKVARAVHYAHERGILHRDLKPGNILLDRKGEPHVTDFGLATRLPSAPGGAGTPSPGRSLTQKGIAVGTPGYMAPEQANGPKNAVTVAADVYSLGAVLYELLTGRPPFQGETPLETLVQVLERPPLRPRALVPSVPRDLETIGLKCLEKDPSRRYASAGALADDLERYLDGQPLQARPASPPERLWRWCRRSPVVATLAAALILALLLGIGAVTALWRRAETHWRAAEAERRQAEAERERAELHRLQAEENFRQAHEIVDRFCMRLSEERLSAVPGLQPLRKEMLEVGLKYYQGFLAQRGDDPRLKADLARAQFRVAFLTALVGSKRDALASYAEALRTYEELLAADPDNADYREQIGRTCIDSGNLLDALDDRPGALTFYERGRDLLEQLDRARPDVPRVIGNLGIVYNNLGNVYRGLNRLDECADAYDRALAAQERLIRNKPNDFRARRELAVVYVNIAVLHATRGSREESLRWHLKARDLQEQLYHDHPRDRDVQHDLALSCRRVGERMVRDGQVPEGLHSLEKGHELIGQLAAANASVADYQRDLAISHRVIGHARRAGGNKEQAARCYRDAIDLLGKAHRQDPSATAYTRDLAATLVDLGLLLADEPAKAREALRAFAPAADLYRELARLRADAATLADLAAACHHVGRMRRDLHNYEGALAAFQEGREVREALLALRPDDPRYRDDLAAAWFYVGWAQDRLKHGDDSIRSYECSHEIREALVKEFPKNIAFHHELGTTLVNLGGAYGQAGRIEECRATLWRAIEEKRIAFAAAPENPEYRHGLNVAYGALGEAEKRKGQPSAAAAALLERRSLWPEQPQELYRIAREQAQTAAAVGRGATDLSAEQQAERTLYLDQALETLRQAVAAGFRDAERLAAEADFAPLRSREDFKKLLPVAKTSP